MFFLAFVLRLVSEVEYCFFLVKGNFTGKDRERKSYFQFFWLFSFYYYHYFFVFFFFDLTSCKTHCDNSTNLPSCSGSIVCIISCNRPWRNFAPVCVLPAVPPLLLPVAPAWLEPAGPERVSLAARDVTEPPGCVAIDVSDEFAALPWSEGRTMDGWYGYGYGKR